MQSSVTWKNEMTFDGLSESNHTIPFEAGPAPAYGATPMEAVLVALCGCTAMDVVSILRKKREPFTGLTVSATAEQAAEPPKVFTSVKLIYRISGAVSEKSMQDAVNLSETKYCSVAAMLSKTAKIEYSIEYAPE